MPQNDVRVIYKTWLSLAQGQDYDSQCEVRTHLQGSADDLYLHIKTYV